MALSSAGHGGRIPVGEMRDRVAAGTAAELFPEFDVGPVFCDGGWWYVPGTAFAEQAYRPAPTDLAETFDRVGAALYAAGRG